MFLKSLFPLIPVFQRLGADDLLQRCLEARTKNANESLLSCIWNKYPKEKFLTKRKISIAVCEAVSEYNFKHTYTTSHRQSKLELSPGSTTLQLAKRRDDRANQQRQK
ncbi:hypothetical protein ANN_08512 [Periplaneta americana]|uniref:Uncharacterized protein n=1 Tax=Periplaneta americana TaxID=6978 RepID=A0ABQ8T306_PERAM|nr:hypothetical protein ANN_08512 [Periplaneta americana]